MVHVRLNQTESNPNHHINFITALPTNAEQQEEARQLLRALAAQVRPVMKAHGFAVNSLEEVHTLTFYYLVYYSECHTQYEYNQVFAGRNWNAGETIGKIFASSFVFDMDLTYILFRIGPETSWRFILSCLLVNEYAMS
jgi:hypothetical protein